MKEKLRNHYLKLGPRRFVILTVILLIILDFLSGYYLKMTWANNALSQKMLALSVDNMKLQLADFSQETINEIMGLVNMTVDFMLVLFFINNLFFYFFYLRKKLWAQSYVLFYTLAAAFLSLAMIFDNHAGMGWMIFNILTIPTYIYLYFGVKLLKPETTLVPEKKAR
jgi:hypothetical protein